MILLDTHTWLWAATAPHYLSAKASETIADAQQVAISVVSCWEAAVAIRRGRLRVEHDARQWMLDVLRQHRIDVLPLSLNIAVAAGSFARELHGDPIDRVLVATAMAYDCPLITKDQKLRAFAPLTTIW